MYKLRQQSCHLEMYGKKGEIVENNYNAVLQTLWTQNRWFPSLDKQSCISGQDPNAFQIHVRGMSVKFVYKSYVGLIRALFRYCCV